MFATLQRPLPAHCCRSTSTRRVAAYEKCCVCNAARLLAVLRPTCMILRIQKRVSGSVSFRMREHLPHQPWPEPYGLPSSASRVAGENGPSVRRAFGHAASPRRRARRPGLPASRARPSPAAPPDCALVCFGLRPKRSRHSIRLPRPVGPFACSGRANLPSKHTHMSVEAYPPDGPRISPRQGSQNFSVRAEPVARGGPVRERAHVSGVARRKLLRPASRRLRRP